MKPINFASVLFNAKIRVSIIRRVRIVNIGGFGEVALFIIEPEYITRLESIIVHHVEVGEHAAKYLDHAYLKVGVTDQLLSNKEFFFLVARFSFHNVHLGLLVIKRESRQHINSKVDTQNQHSCQGKWHLKK